WRERGPNAALDRKIACAQGDVSMCRPERIGTDEIECAEVDGLVTEGLELVEGLALARRLGGVGWARPDRAADTDLGMLLEVVDETEDHLGLALGAVPHDEFGEG